MWGTGKLPSSLTPQCSRTPPRDTRFAVCKVSPRTCPQGSVPTRDKGFMAILDPAGPRRSPERLSLSSDTPPQLLVPPRSGFLLLPHPTLLFWSWFL